MSAIRSMIPPTAHGQFSTLIHIKHPNHIHKKISSRSAPIFHYANKGNEVSFSSLADPRKHGHWPLYLVISRLNYRNPVPCKALLSCRSSSLVISSQTPRMRSRLLLKKKGIPMLRIFSLWRVLAFLLSGRAREQLHPEKSRPCLFNYFLLFSQYTRIFSGSHVSSLCASCTACLFF